ncbi:hypothetical protein L9F63_011752 [Diploptera punctata]|uniref:Uncharacterized protein n=1 Tax=Diploptera punctata TaxID=6984 RepID=A0AAD8ADY1_DIPPU|nr:hypothetical protein L9F63_011752 [Diploptera punctata]
MGLHERERQLSILYGAATCLSLITIICIAVPWTHWKQILDTCTNYSCGCILYGTNYFYVYNGGNTSMCQFTTFAPIPVLVIAIIMAGYHGYRVCMSGKKVKRKQKRNGDVAVIESRSGEPYDGPGLKWLIALIVIACCVSALLAVSTVTLIDGYYTTCREYRHHMTKWEVVNGQMASVINGRLQCGAIFDFMDYMEPIRRPFFRKDYINYNYPHEEKDYERGGFINTGLSLQIAISSACINCVTWGLIIINYAVLIYSSGECCSK